jgi:hypothetical protein
MGQQSSLFDELRRRVDKRIAARSTNAAGSTPPDLWPVWARALKQFSTPDDKGIGDVVARMIGDENSMKFKAWHLATFGRPCGCVGRQERWNKQYPL